MGSNVVWGENCVKKVDLTPEEYTKLQDTIIDRGRFVKKENPDFNERQFLCGVLVTMEALGIGMPVWAVSSAIGESVI